MNLLKLEEVLTSKIKEKDILRGISKGKRLDGRKPFEYRDIQVFPNLLDKANASALVSLGDTKVLAGLTLEIGEPFPDRPEKGVFMTNIELSPLASPVFELGPPSDYAIELSRVVDRGIREAEIVDLDKLSIIPGEKVWMIFIDLYPLDNGGNLIDASTIAVVVALYNIIMPEIEVDFEAKEIEKLDEKAGPLPLDGLVTSVTFAQKDEHMIVDPTYAEENVMDTRFTISFTEKGEICAIQKGKRGEMSPQRIKRFEKKGRKKAKELKNVISNVLSREGKEYKNLVQIFRKITGGE